MALKEAGDLPYLEVQVGFVSRADRPKEIYVLIAGLMGLLMGFRGILVGLRSQLTIQGICRSGFLYQEPSVSQGRLRRYILPGSKKHLKKWPFGLFPEALGHYYLPFFGVQVLGTCRVLS